MKRLFAAAIIGLHVSLSAASEPVEVRVTYPNDRHFADSLLEELDGERDYEKVLRMLEAFKEEGRIPWMSTTNPHERNGDVLRRITVRMARAFAEEAPMVINWFVRLHFVNDLLVEAQVIREVDGP